MMVKVRVNEGILEGELVDDDYEGRFYSFKGIPYALPPVGELRFKAPQPVKPWKGVLHAKKFGPICPQFDYFARTMADDCNEDCLYLNVYTPELKPNKPLAVMVWIHGGAFSSGSGRDEPQYGPEFVKRKDVILVTFNYRLEVLGFLCLDTEDVPGNAGMKDQVAALRWVKSNIASFGGDPENVTIFGERAGGSCVSYHLLSPMSKGLFKRAIIQSGVAMNPWTQSFEPQKRALAVARKLGFTSGDDDKLYEFFKLQPVTNLIAVQLPLTFSESANIAHNIIFNVVSEKKFGNIEMFFYGDVADATRKGIHEDVDIVVGYAKRDGLCFLSTIIDWDKMIEEAETFPEFFVPDLLKENCSIRAQIDIGTMIRDYYFGDGNIKMDDWEIIEKFYTLDQFVYGIVQWQKMCASMRKSNVYAYKFTYEPEIGGRPKAPVVDRIKQLWTNFAKYGNPTPDDSLGVKWIPYTIEEQETLDIGEQLTMCMAPDRDDIEFYEEIYRKYLPSYVADTI